MRPTYGMAREWRSVEEAERICLLDPNASPGRCSPGSCRLFGYLGLFRSTLSSTPSLLLPRHASRTTSPGRTVQRMKLRISCRIEGSRKMAGCMGHRSMTLALTSLGSHTGPEGRGSKSSPIRHRRTTPNRSSRGLFQQVQLSFIPLHQGQGLVRNELEEMYSKGRQHISGRINVEVDKKKAKL
jgi:hypothetical protein